MIFVETENLLLKLRIIAIRKGNKIKRRKNVKVFLKSKFVAFWRIFPICFVRNDIKLATVGLKKLYKITCLFPFSVNADIIHLFGLFSDYLTVLIFFSQIKKILSVFFFKRNSKILRFK